MSTADKYVIPQTMDATWNVPMDGDARFTWEYDGGRDRLLSLYQKGKDKQWDQTTRIDWSLEVDPYDSLGLPDEIIAIHGTPVWDRMSTDEKMVLKQHQASWQFSQFLHGEQGAMICSARIVESVPDLDSKFYAATQTMDEARHAETYARFLQEKIGLVYPINDNLSKLLEETLTDSRWHMPYLGMQVLIEGLALMIANDEVPELLKGVEILGLDLGLLQAGASVKGEFEKRVKMVIDEVNASTKSIIIFID